MRPHPDLKTSATPSFRRALRHRIDQPGRGTILWFVLLISLAASGAAAATPHVSAGDNHTLALAADGTVWEWGRGSLLPSRVSTLGSVTAVAAGQYHSLALAADGTVWAWGKNDGGQLGDGTQTNRDVPVQVLGLPEIVGIAGGDVHSVALAKDGTVWVWGANDSGQLGTGDGESHLTPVQVPEVSGAASVGAGDLHTLVLTADGTLFAWGDNSRGQVGDGTQGNIRETPVRVSGLSQVRAIDPGCGHSMALHQDGTVWVWGRSRYDDVGLDRPLPTKVTGLENVVSIAAGNRHSAAVKADGTVWTWGLNWEGQLGTGDLLDQPFPAEMSIPEPGKAVQVAAYDITIVRTQTGRLFAAGDNEQGQIGDGTSENRLAAVPVLDEAGSGPLLLAAPSPGTDGGGGGNCFLRAARLP